MIDEYSLAEWQSNVEQDLSDILKRIEKLEKKRGEKMRYTCYHCKRIVDESEVIMGYAESPIVICSIFYCQQCYGKNKENLE